MEKAHLKTAFIFRRDLRLEDNLGLLAALEASQTVVPCFIFDPRQCDRDQNKYFSEPAFQFLLSSLNELDQELQKKGSRLHIFHGDPADIVKQLINQDKVDAIVVNKDYTPFARTRDQAIADICAGVAGEKDSVFFTRHDDVCLSPIEHIRTGQDKIYTVFTPFMKNAAQHDVPEPRPNTYTNYFDGTLQTAQVNLSDFSADIDERELVLCGGRAEALTILAQPIFLKKYQDNRNRTDRPEGTSRLSAHHKFGTISIRETYDVAAQQVGSGSHFVFELYWRDFYYYTTYHFPHVFKESFLPWAKYIEWENDTEKFAAWCQGRTGVPMVDAGMRQLNHTGFMHNRTRMVVASYLTKNLLIDWRWGERYFAQNLIDYDPAQNNGGWQWSASVGTDPKPLRIFNPYIQAVNYDPEADYIHQWIPELSEVDHRTLTDGKTQDFSGLYTQGYPTPLVDQKESYRRAREVYKAAKDAWREEQASQEST